MGDLRWVRHGECTPDACGSACCKEFGVYELKRPESPDGDDVEFYTVRGIEVRDWDENWRLLVVPHVCQALTADGRCGVHEQKPVTSRPQFEGAILAAERGEFDVLLVYEGLRL